MKLNSLSDMQKLLPEPAKPAVTDKKGHDGRGAVVRITLDTKGRKGKTVTLVSGLQHNPTTMQDIARKLKERCGTGGTVKERTIELQGDQQARAKALLEEMNYTVK